jgi:hypothetical protein
MLTNTHQHSSAAEQLCPCGKASRAEMQRIPRGFILKTFFFWLPLKRYKCYKCMRNKLVLR